jgi:hypothetical protein
MSPEEIKYYRTKAASLLSHQYEDFAWSSVDEFGSQDDSIDANIRKLHGLQPGKLYGFISPYEATRPVMATGNELSILDAVKYTKGLPSQMAAWKLLDEKLPDTLRLEFAELYRSPNPTPPKPTGDSYLYCKWSGKYDSKGGKIFDLYFIQGDRVIDQITCCSGLPQYQEVVWPLDDYSGSCRPCPEGVYDIGKVDDLGYDPDDHDGFGRYVIFLEPRAPINRGDFRIHIDWNRNISPGSAGCLSPYEMAQILKVVGWCRSANPPTYLIVDHALGFLKEQKIKVPLMGK